MRPPPPRFPPPSSVFINFFFFALYNHKILCYNYIKVQSKGVTLNEMYVLRL